MTWDQQSENHITLSERFSPFVVQFLRIALIILHRATIRLLLLVREKKPPILTFLNLYLTLHKIHGSA